MNRTSERPRTLAEVALGSRGIEDFGLLLRDWVHHVLRNDISNRSALSSAIAAEPRLLKRRFEQGEVADAYLAAYAEWIADRARIERPAWTGRKSRVLESPWFAGKDRAALLVLTPASFRQRGVFTIPEDVVKLRRGRPRVSETQKREKARLRDKRYRQRVREWIAAGRAGG